MSISRVPSQPTGVASDVIDWIRICLTSSNRPPFLSVNVRYDSDRPADRQQLAMNPSWDLITPRTMMFQRFFQELSSRNDPIGVVEIMHSSGITIEVVDTLPEAVLTPLRDAISRCQARPPPSWTAPLLKLVNRGDISQIFAPGQKARASNGNVLVSNLFIPISYRGISSV